MPFLTNVCYYVSVLNIGNDKNRIKIENMEMLLT